MTRAKIRRIAERFIQENNLSIPVELDAVTQAVNAVIIKQVLPDSVSGWLVMPYADITEHIIVVNSLHPPCRQRYTVLHEVGHIKLDHIQDNKLSLTHLYLSDDHYGVQCKNRIEREANIFAAELLLPEKHLTDFVTIYGCEDIEFICKFYEASKQALQIRLKELFKTK